jgi:hypothetical protein
LRRSGGGSGGAGGAGSAFGARGGSGAGLAVFSPFMIWLICDSERTSTGIASWLSSNFRAAANPRIRNNSRAPWSAPETAQAQYGRRSLNAVPGYWLAGSVTSATFRKPACVTDAMICATRP